MMDVNGSRFHLVQGYRDWAPELRRQQQVDHESGQIKRWDEGFAGVSLARRLFVFPSRRNETPPSLADRRGAAGDAYGNLFWLGDGGAVYWSTDGGGNEKLYWHASRLTEIGSCPSGQSDFDACTPPAATVAPELRGLAVTEHNYLVVGTLEPAGLLIFDLFGGGPPVWRKWPRQVPFAPFDMTPAPDGGLWILDRGPEIAMARIWRLDCYFRIVPAMPDLRIELAAPREKDFNPVCDVVETVPALDFPAGHELGMASPLEIAEPISIEALPDGTILILETDSASPSSASFVHRYRDGSKCDEIQLDGALLELVSPAVRGHDFAFTGALRSVAGQVVGELFVVSEDGNQAFVFSLSASDDRLVLDLQARYLPMRRYDGKSLIPLRSEVLYHLPSLWTPLSEQPRPRFEQEWSLEMQAFDGKIPGCVWHRLIADACIPPGDGIRVESRAADELGQLDDMPWFQEPALYLRSSGSELPYHWPFQDTSLKRPGMGSWELLFQRARGRYLQLRLHFYGSGHTSPRLRALRVWYPRFSYLEQYLPAVYRDDAESADFLDRFLANAEGLLTTLEGQVAEAQRLFDSRTAPAEYLDWLAGWFGASLDPDWDEGRRRLFLENAALLFRWRGTAAGLLAMIRLVIEPCPDLAIFDDLRNPRAAAVVRYGGRSVRIVEQFQVRRFPGVVLGDPGRPEQPVLLGSGSAYSSSQGPDPIHQRFRLFLLCKYQGDEAAIANVWEQESAQLAFPPLPPGQVEKLRDWRDFLERGIGFTYAEASLTDAGFYQAFLESRYLRITALKEAWGLAAGGAADNFGQIPLPEQLPENRAQLTDWLGFVSLALPVERNAYRFTVLVPADPADSIEERERRLAKVEAIVKRERPAHTEFEVRLFWALFQVGSARLGLDTVLGEGSRYVAVVLGKTALADGFLPPSYPWCASGRESRVIGRDFLTEKRQ